MIEQLYARSAANFLLQQWLS